MLVINYNGNKPTTDYYNYSVQGNNNADVVWFNLSKQQGNIDLSECESVYVKVISKDEDFLDKVDISNDVSVVGNLVEAKWTLLRKHTINRQLQVSLSFENANNEVVWQTQIVNIKISGGLDVEDEIPNTYPTLIDEMLGDIETLKAKKIYRHSISIKGGQYPCSILLYSTDNTPLNEVNEYNDSRFGLAIPSDISIALIISVRASGTSFQSVATQPFVVYSKSMNFHCLTFSTSTTQVGNVITLLRYENKPTSITDTITEL